MTPARLTLAALATAGAVGGLTAFVVAGDDAPATQAIAAREATTSTAHDHPGAGARAGNGDGAGGARGARGAGAGHAHPRQEPYPERYAAASPEEQVAADDLVAATRAAVSAYPNPEAAEAAGYRPPRRAGGRTQHYLNPTLAADGDVLDPAHPEGLVFTEGPDGPELIGAFFTARPGVEVPVPAGELVTWHSHNPDRPAFFASADEPRTDTRRMLHVWTAETVDLVSRRGDEVTVEVLDPFGAPFLASVTRQG